MKNVVNRSQLGNPGELLSLAKHLKRDFEEYTQNGRFELKSEELITDNDFRNDISVVRLLEEHFSSTAHST